MIYAIIILFLGLALVVRNLYIVILANEIDALEARIKTLENRPQ